LGYSEQREAPDDDDDDHHGRKREQGGQRETEAKGKREAEAQSEGEEGGKREGGKKRHMTDGYLVSLFFALNDPTAVVKIKKELSFTAEEFPISGYCLFFLFLVIFFSFSEFHFFFLQPGGSNSIMGAFSSFFSRRSIFRNPRINFFTRDSVLEVAVHLAPLSGNVVEVMTPPLCVEIHPATDIFPRIEKKIIGDSDIFVARSGNEFGDIFSVKKVCRGG
jgi:hypothetical protein